MNVNVRFSVYPWSQTLRCLVFFCITACSVMVGCGKAKKPWEIVHPVTGTVTYQGKPLSDARITLVPKNKETPNIVRPTAVSAKDGTFIIGTYSTKDGAPVGDYKAIVVRFPVIVTASNAVSGPNDLPPKYSTADSTDLTVSVGAGTNQLPPLELK